MFASYNNAKPVKSPTNNHKNGHVQSNTMTGKQHNVFIEDDDDDIININDCGINFIEEDNNASMNASLNNVGGSKNNLNNSKGNVNSTAVNPTHHAKQNLKEHQITNQEYVVNNEQFTHGSDRLNNSNYSAAYNCNTADFKGNQKGVLTLAQSPVAKSNLDKHSRNNQLEDEEIRIKHHHQKSNSFHFNLVQEKSYSKYGQNEEFVKPNAVTNNNHQQEDLYPVVKGKNYDSNCRACQNNKQEVFKLRKDYLNLKDDIRKYKIALEDRYNEINYLKLELEERDKIRERDANYILKQEKEIQRLDDILLRVQNQLKYYDIELEKEKERLNIEYYNRVNEIKNVYLAKYSELLKSKNQEGQDMLDENLKKYLSTNSNSGNRIKNVTINNKFIIKSDGNSGGLQGVGGNMKESNNMHKTHGYGMNMQDSSLQSNFPLSKTSQHVYGQNMQVQRQAQLSGSGNKYENHQTRESQQSHYAGVNQYQTNQTTNMHYNDQKEVDTGQKVTLLSYTHTPNKEKNMRYGQESIEGKQIILDYAAKEPFDYKRHSGTDVEFVEN